jgi:DNA-binding CsgD family transcriptional regulator/tetratricopeptide (TPR) repeat protein
VRVTLRCRQVFGREAEQTLLRRELAKVREGHGGFVLLTGSAGMGKSRLAADLLGDAERAGISTALGRATGGEASVPYRPLTQALLHMIRAGTVPNDPEFESWRAALGPVLAGPQSRAGTARGGAVHGEAVVQLLSRLVPAGAVVVIEDLHWADPDSVSVLDYLADGVGVLPVLWLVTARESDAVIELADRLRGRRGFTAVSLGPLSPAAVAHMVGDCRPDADAVLLERVQRVAEGVPLFVEEFAAARSVTESFARAVLAQLDSLDRATRRVVEASAVLGDEGSRLLIDVADCDAVSLTAALRQAIDAGLMVQGPEVPRFRHVLTREAVLEAMGRRRGEVASVALAVAGPEPAEWVADLAEQAGEQRRAGQLLATAATRAAHQGALSTAIETFGRAVRLLVTYPEGDSVRLRLVEVLSLAGRIDEALTEAEVVLAANPSPAARLVTAEVAARGARWMLATRHLSEAEPGGRRDLLGAEVAFAVGRTDDARAAALLVADDEDADLRCRALILLGRLDRLTDLGAARSAFERALAVARVARLPVRELDALHELGTIEMLGHCGTGMLLDARRAAERLGALGTRAVLDLQLTAAYLGRFDTASAERHARAAAATADRLGLVTVAAKSRCGLAEVFAQRLDAQAMERLLAEATAIDPDDPFTPAFGWGQCRGMLALYRGDVVEALACLERGVELLAAVSNPEPVEFRSLWPLLLASVSDPRAAAALAAADVSDLNVTFANRGLLAYAAAILAGDDRAAAADLALRGDAYLVRFPVWAHLARWVAAEPATTAGWGRPAGWLAEAEPAFAALGFEALAISCRRDGGRGLTGREADVLVLVSDGLSNKEIAARLHLSTRTVEKHVESALRKTGSRSRTQLAVWAVRQTT